MHAEFETTKGPQRRCLFVYIGFWVAQKSGASRSSRALKLIQHPSTPLHTMDPSLSSSFPLDTPFDLERTPRRPSESSILSAHPGNKVGYLPSTARMPLGSAVTNGESSRRLKRLSLVAKPSTSSAYHEYSGQENAAEKRNSDNGAGPSTPRRSVGMRSSIAYSPAISTRAEQRESRGRASFENRVIETDRTFESMAQSTDEGAVHGQNEEPRAEGRRADQRAAGERTSRKGETLLEK